MDFDRQDGRVIARFALIQAVDGGQQDPGDAGCRAVFLDRAGEKRLDLRALPAHVEQLAHPGMDDAVAVQDDRVACVQGEVVFADFLAGHHPGVRFHIGRAAFVEPHTRRIVKFNDRTLAILENLQDAEGRIGNLAFVADGQGAGNGFYHFIEFCASLEHCRDDLAGQGRQDVRLDSAAQAVSQHCQHIIVLADNFDLVTAELFPLLVDAFKSDIEVKFRSRLSHPAHLPSRRGWSV